MEYLRGHVTGRAVDGLCGSAPTGTGAPQGRRDDAAQFFGCQAVTPETERTSHYFFQQSHGSP